MTTLLLTRRPAGVVAAWLAVVAAVALVSTLMIRAVGLEVRLGTWTVIPGAETAPRSPLEQAARGLLTPLVESGVDTRQAPRTTRAPADAVSRPAREGHPVSGPAAPGVVPPSTMTGPAASTSTGSAPAGTTSPTAPTTDPGTGTPPSGTTPDTAPTAPTDLTPTTPTQPAPTDAAAPAPTEPRAQAPGSPAPTVPTLPAKAQGVPGVPAQPAIPVPANKPLEPKNSQGGGKPTG